jgi:tape measure domain-containing protein
MAQNNFNVELQLQAKALGFEDINKLQQALRDLAKQGGDAAPEFTRLADEVSRLGDISQELDSFRALGAEVDNLAQEQSKASTTAKGLKTDLETLAQATEDARQREVAAKQAIIDAQNALGQKKDQLKLLKLETDDSAKKQDEYKQAIKSASTEIIAANASIRDLRDAYRAARSETTSAAEAESAAESAYRKANKELGASTTALSKRREVLNQSKAALDEAGIATESLAAAELSLANAGKQTLQASAAQIKARDDATNAAKRQAQEEERLAIIVAETRARMEAAARAEADGIIRDFDRMKQAEQDAANAAKKAASDMDNAFKTVGTRSVADLRTEIDKVKSAFDLLKASGTLSAAEIGTATKQAEGKVRGLEREIRALEGTLTLGDRAAMLFSTSIERIAVGNLVANAVGTIVAKVSELGRTFVDTVTKSDAMNRALTAIYKSSRVAADQIAFLKRTASENGIVFSDLTDSFVRFSAATKSANIPLQVTNDVFVAVTRAASTLGLSSETVDRILLALSQTASKGVVSMEELRQQLGDSLPGALSLTAKGLGITEQQLVKLAETGQLATADFLPALSKGLGELQGSTDGVSQTFARFKNQVTTVLTALGDAGFTTLLVQGMKGLGIVVGAVSTVILGFTEAINLAARAVGVLVTTLTGQATSKTFSDFGDQVQASANRLRGLQAANEAAANGFAGIGSSSQAAGSQIATTTTAMGSATSGALQLAAAQSQLATSNNTVAQTTSGTGNAYVQLLATMAENTKRIELNIEAAGKNLKAKKEESAAIENLSKLTGDEAAIRGVAQRAAEENLVSSQALVKAHEKQVAATQATIAAITEYGKANGGLREDQIKLIQTLGDKLKVQDAELSQAKQQRTSFAEQAAAAELATKTFGDQSGKLDELSRSYVDARANLVIYKSELDAAQANLANIDRRLAEGKSSQDDLTAATTRAVTAQENYSKAAEKAAVAQGQLRDAIDDTKKALDRQQQALDNSRIVATAGINLDIARAKSMEALGKATGSTTLITNGLIDAKQAERKQLELNAKLDREYADNLLNAAEAIKANIEKQRELTAEEKAEYDRSVAQAQAKKLSADAIKENAKALDSEIAALLTGTRATQDNTKAVEDNIKAKQKAEEEAQKKADAERAANLAPVDASGNFTLAEKLKRGALTIADRALVEGVYKAASANLEMMQRNQTAFSFDGARGIEAQYNEAKRAMEIMQSIVSSDANKTSRAQTQPPQQVQPATQTPSASQPSGTYTVNVNLGGTSTSIRVASQADATAMSKLFQQLEAKMGTAA